MLILDSDQVQYCQVVATIKGEQKIESGLIYQNNVFIKVKTYSKEDLQLAIKECREDYLDNEDIEVPTLIIKSDKDITLWLEDKRFEPKQDKVNTAATIKKKESSKINLKELVTEMRGSNGLEVKTRRHQLKLYQRCFVGSEAVDWLVKYLNISRKQAVAIGQKLVDKKVIHHVNDEHLFKDDNLLYRFYEDEGKNIWTDKLL
ncbi:MAG: DEP domain-containing protein [Xenococcaceae cyanobacterium]